MVRYKLNGKFMACCGLGVMSGLGSLPGWAEEPSRPIDLVGQSLTLGPDAPFNSYRLKDGAQLTVQGARLGSITNRNSVLTVKDHAHIQGEVRGAGLGQTSISNSTVSVDRNIAMIVQDNHRAEVVDSIFTGVRAGISVVSSTFSAQGTRMIGTQAHDSGLSWGLGVLGSRAFVTSGSEAIGASYGLLVSYARSLTPGPVDPGYSQVVIDDSTFQGLAGAALMVDSWGVLPTTADIEVRNGSRLLSGINVLAEARRESTLNLTVDDSVLSGDLLADDTSTINLVLQNNARLTGDIVGGDQVAVASGARWTLTGDNEIGALTLDGGGVDFGTGSFKELVMSSLSGNGHFAMRVDLDQGDGDLLWVEGPATGQFGLHVRNTGSEAVTPELEPLLLVHTEGGDAQFSLTGERVDLGAFSYQLQQQGNDWFIVADDRRISPSTASALALFNAAPSIWMSELNSLRSRIGEVRGAGAAGGWMRSYGSRLEATTGDGVDYRQKQRGFSLGADAPVPVANGQLSLGVLVGHSRSDLDLNHGTTGSVDSVYLGGYGTWLSEQGYYVDAVLKLNHLRNKSKVAMSDSGRAKGSYDTLAAGASVEFGRHVQLADGWFVEPFTQLAAVNVSGDRYQLDNGLRASNDHTRSVLGKVGASLGRDIALKDGGVLQPYVRLAAAQEFSRRNPVEVNGHRFDNDLFGSRLEAGAGVSVSLSERLQLQADFDYMDGKRIEQPWGANLGLRLAF